VQTEIKSSHIKLLRSKILGPLCKHMHEGEQGSDKKIRVHVAISIIKLIRVLPLNIFKTEFIRVINKIAVTLQSRENEVRDSARKALLEIALTTGPFFLHFILQELKFHLDKGFMLHTRNYTVHYILAQLVPTIKVGSIDYCLDLLVPMLNEEILGSLEEEKEVREIKNKSVEFKGKHGYDCYKLIGTKLNFQGEALLEIFKMIETQLLTATDLTKAINKCTELFRNLIEGLIKNTSIDTDSVFLLTYAMNQRAITLLVDKISENSNEIAVLPEFDSKLDLQRNNLAKTYKIQEGAASGKSLSKMISEKKLSRENLIGKALANFIMMLFQRSLKKKILKFDFSNHITKKEINEKFDPLIDQFLKLLNSDYNELVLVSLNIISHIINFPLFAIRKNNKRILKALLKILKTIQGSDLELIQVCFKMIRKLIQSNRFSLKDSYITQVFGFIKEYIYPADWVTEPLNCLETLISVKLIKSDIYELIDKAFEIMLVSMDPGIINTSKRCILKFIENFPLTEELYEKYFWKLIKNIDFPEETGRKTIISIIELLVRKLPDDFLEKFIDLYYFSLVTRFINEEVPKLRVKITQT
jgi:U3 small nucleolar RNA-associated protein 20